MKTSTSKTLSKVAPPKATTRKNHSDVEECKEEEAPHDKTKAGLTDPATKKVKSGDKNTTKTHTTSTDKANKKGLKENGDASDEKSKQKGPKKKKNQDFEDVELTGKWGAVSKTEVIIVSAMVILIAVAVTVALVIFLGDNDSDGSSNVAGLEPESPVLTPNEQMELIRSALENNPITNSVWNDLGEDAIENPYRMAASWIVEEDTFDREADIMPRFALAAIYYATGGNEWLDTKGWLTNTPICDDWRGVNCDQLGKVVELELPDNNLKGPFPVPVVLLESLKSLWLENNNLEGPLPVDLFPEMTNLQFLYVQHNKFNGAIPGTFLDNGNKLRKSCMS